MTEPILLRDARADEAESITELALRSKGYWGYSDDFMKACRDELAVTPDAIQQPHRRYIVADLAGVVVGYYVLIPHSAEQMELDALFVDPDHIGTGIGKQLMDDAKQSAIGDGASSLIVQSDPNAEGFYRAMGGEVIAQTPSGSIAGRFLPTLAIALA